MTKLELLEMLLRDAKDYRKEGIAESLIRNRHMNDWEGNKSDFDQDLADAILVDFINKVAYHQGVDYGLYVKDLRDER